jgi:ferric-dicitrate binding protein FerR (iron transport regulator)
MRTSIGEPKDSPALAQATELCREILGSPTEQELDQGLERFLAHIGPRPARARRAFVWTLAGASLAVCVLATLQITHVIGKRVSAPGSATLAYRIEGGSVIEGGYLRESGGTGMSVLFNEGSRLALTPGTRGRLRVVARDTAHVAIEKGEASFQVTHKNSRRWLVDVGPFLVTVTGTVFTASWDPVGEQFDLRLREGHVLVSGPVAAGEIPLRAGQRLVANLAKVQTLITEEAPTPTRDDPAVPPSAPAVMPAPGLSPRPAQSPEAKRAADHQWGRRLARGQWDRILDEANRKGIEATLAEACNDDLFALANAARYRHRFDLARSALLAERRRFPSSSRALEAMYLLGRVEESEETRTGKAIEWYDEYLSHAPNGPLAGEALGRKMTLTDRLEGPARARSLAQEYLRRFPKGNYAGSARELLAP